MDNTDIKRDVVLVRNKTKKKVVVARGNGSRTIGDVLIARLRPFRFAIITGLKKHGINTTGVNFKTLVILYHNEYAVGGQVKPVPITQFINSAAFKLKTDDKATGDTGDARNMASFMDIVDTVTRVINVFKVAKVKYSVAVSRGDDPKQVMTDEEYVQAKACFIVEDSLLRKMKGDNYLKAGQVKKFVIWAVIIGVGIYLLSRL